MRAAVIGANGALGSAFVTHLAASGRCEVIHAFGRRPGRSADAAVRPGILDVGDEGSIAAASRTVSEPLDLVLVATGLLHADGHQPERALKQLTAERLMRSFAINTVGPALVLRHFAPLLPRCGRAVVAVLSARVGSISDNRSGGWYGYRASKAALNMVVRCAAIELARTRPDALCVALHPGTVDSALSRPFQANVAPEQLFTPDDAARRLLAVIDGLGSAQSGRCFAWDGAEIAP